MQIEAAASICGEDGDVVDGLASLTAKGLLRAGEVVAIDDLVEALSALRSQRPP